MLRLVLYVAFALLCCDARAETVVDAGDVIDVKPLPHTSGFYYEPVNKMQFVENVWTFIIEIDHGAIFLELHDLFNETVKFIDYINSSNIVNCSSKPIVQVELKSYILNKIYDLVEKHNNIDVKISKIGKTDSDENDQARLNHPNAEHLTGKAVRVLKQRQKRSPLDFVGSAYKYVFGIMDHNDADLLHKVAKTENAMNSQVKQLTDELISLTDYVSHINCIEREKNDVCVYIEAKKNLLQAQLGEIDALYTNLDRAVDDALSKKINSMIMNPKRLYDELVNVTAHLPAKTSWPVSLELKNMRHLINNNVLSINVFRTKERKLLFIIEVPLLNQQQYNVFQVVPIPFCVKSKCAVIVPDSKYLGLSTNRHNYVRLGDDISKTCRITIDNLLCYKQKIVHDSDKAILCDIKILLDSNNDNGVDDAARDCDVRVGKFDSEIFYEISSDNRWLYVLQKDTRLVFDCDADVSVNPIILKAGTGLMQGKDVDYNCKISTSRMDLPWKKTTSRSGSTTSVIVLPILTSFNLSASLVDFDKIEVQSFRSNVDLDHKNLNGMTERLIDLRKRLENNTVFFGQDVETSTDDDDSGWFCWFVGLLGVKCRVAESVLASIILLIVCLFIFKMYKCMCPGLCSNLCTRSNNATVVRVNSKLQFVETKKNKRSKTPIVKYVSGRDETNYEDDDENNDCSKVFISK
ncbi:F protein [Euproctis pseudoconspersa nucleopolyhedrovirus]|uniref:F protein n=1 Tax=Euproctis pseudoconspersa nucleopolyhedrovirus TaxID=307467 RepID=C3TX42_9ABAC|nr:F protein [Euproctis pseudoconspersa nucleopolyhedrovirus]ACO53584.1 F protein [Euproctis pseudoconspersa nucleopolyhedrovirus]QUJ09324.1 F protein [Gynaephora ruoergensis nucleopolyhedrovirus]